MMDGNAWIALAGLIFVILSSLLGLAWYIAAGQTRIETKLDTVLKNQDHHESEDDRRFSEVWQAINDLRSEARTT